MVEFLIAGVQKGGTTALFSFLSRHPKLFLPPCKEVHYFDDESVDWQSPDYSRLDAYFRDRSSGQIAGEATPIYTYWQPSAERIQRYNPAMRLIVLLRDPSGRRRNDAEMIAEFRDPFFDHWKICT